MRTALVALLLLSSPGAAAAQLPIFDAHVHYSHDAWDTLPPAEAIAILRKAGVQRALVSSSGDDGTQRLVAAAPDLVVPSLRPYRTRGELGILGARRHGVAVPRGAARELPLRRHRRVPRSTAPTPTCRCRAGWSRWPSSTGCSCTRTPTPTPSSGCSSRTQARILWAHSGFDRPEKRARDAAHAHDAVVRPRVPQRSRPRAARSTRSGARCSSSSPTASWSAPTPSRPSAGTTSSSTPSGRAPGSPTCRPTSPSASLHATAKRCSRARRHAAVRRAAVAALLLGLAAVSPAAAQGCGTAVTGDGRDAIESPRYVVVYRPRRRRSSSGGTSPSTSRCARAASAGAGERARRRPHAGAPARHELPARW